MEVLKKFSKLNRAEMKKVIGGGAGDCENACGGTAGSCATGQTCKSFPCPSDNRFYYNVCKSANEA